MIQIFILSIIIIIVCYNLCCKYKKDNNIKYTKFIKNNIVIFLFLLINILCLVYELNKITFYKKNCLDNDISRPKINKIYRPYIDSRAMYMDVI